MLASAQAQTYFGIGGARLISPSSGSVPLLSVQVGGRAAPELDYLEVRTAFDTLLLFSDLSLDAFASVRPYDAPLRVYFGGGPNASLVPVGDGGFTLSLHATAGLEYFTGDIGIHGESGFFGRVEYSAVPKIAFTRRTVRNFQQPPVKNFLVENREGKHIY